MNDLRTNEQEAAALVPVIAYELEKLTGETLPVFMRQDSRDVDAPAGIECEHIGPGARLYIRGEWNNRKRLAVSCGWPKNAKGEVKTPSRVYGERAARIEGRKTEITCAKDRGAEAIARDILRRLIPDYTVIYAELMAVAAVDDAYQSKAAATVARLVKIPGASMTRESDNTVYFPCCTVRVNGDSVSFDRLSVSADAAETILRALFDPASREAA